MPSCVAAIERSMRAMGAFQLLGAFASETTIPRPGSCATETRANSPATKMPLRMTRAGTLKIRSRSPTQVVLPSTSGETGKGMGLLEDVVPLAM